MSSYVGVRSKLFQDGVEGATVRRDGHAEVDGVVMVRRLTPMRTPG
jgi:hypothetical protein